MPLFLLQIVLKNNNDNKKPTNQQRQQQKNLAENPLTIKKEIIYCTSIGCNRNYTFFSIILHFPLICFTSMLVNLATEFIENLVQ